MFKAFSIFLQVVAVTLSLTLLLPILVILLLCRLGGAIKGQFLYPDLEEIIDIFRDEDTYYRQRQDREEK